MRPGWLAVLFAILAAKGASAAHAAPTSPAEATCRMFPGLNVLFRFGTGSPPVAEPAIGRDGALYIGTREGYVHALHADGSYRWSYTLKGTVAGRPGLIDTGAVLVPTRRQIYALRADGTLLWLFNSPVVIQGGLARDPAGRFHFASNDGRVFAFSSRGALVGHVPGRVRVSAQPLPLSDGALAVGRDDGSVTVAAKGGRSSRYKLEASVSLLLGCPGAQVCALSGGTLHALGGSGPEFRVQAVRAASSGDFLAVLPSDERLELYRGAHRERAFSVALPGSASARPVVDAAGTTYVPLRSGALVAVSAEGAITSCVAISSAPLGAPVLDAPRRRLLVTSSEGLLAAIALE